MQQTKNRINYAKPRYQL
ncbi:hypothetical protein, partial [Neisseria meningitidis]